jgi:hypothetical protein
MNWHRSSPNPPRGGTFKPRVEGLEQRELPAANFFVDGSTLIITAPASRRGGRPNSTVVINDNGSNEANNVTAFSGGFFVPNVRITAVVVALGAGNDDVTYNLTGNLQSGRGVSVGLGPGNDTFSGFFRQNLNTNAALSLSVSGGNGFDRMTNVVVSQMLAGSNFTTFFDGGGGNDRLTVQTSTFAGVAAGASYNTAILGGGGNDTINDNYQGVLNGTMSLLVQAGKGDGGRQSAGASVSILPGSTGTFVPSAVVGGRGNERLRFVLFNNSSAVAVNQFIVAGRGFDVCTRTANVAASAATATGSPAEPRSFLSSGRGGPWGWSPGLSRSGVRPARGRRVRR